MVATCLTLVGFLLPGPARAQAVRGTVTDEATGEAVDGAFVILVDDADTRRASTLTGSRTGVLLIYTRDGGPRR